MAWLKIDDGMTEHHKILSLERRDRWTWFEVLCYVARQNNGGHVTPHIGQIVRHATPGFVARCKDAGLLDDTDEGLVVHDWEEYNPKDATGAERQKRYRRRHRNDDASVTRSVTDA